VYHCGGQQLASARVIKAGFVEGCFSVKKSKRELRAAKQWRCSAWRISQKRTALPRLRHTLPAGAHKPANPTAEKPLVVRRVSDAEGVNFFVF
jgi:hypothetical protein